jgi:hypothetical protein
LGGSRLGRGSGGHASQGYPMNPEGVIEQGAVRAATPRMW